MLATFTKLSIRCCDIIVKTDYAPAELRQLKLLIRFQIVKIYTLLKCENIFNSKLSIRFCDLIVNTAIDITSFVSE
ncbi:MAG: hypothetical protein KJ666_13645 [Bacteroidetes bacterium]|nr:hypothetical protein [Bacteroidota bacterium]